jgi:hypothetical protein
MKLNYLYILALVIVLTFIAVKGIEKAVVDQTQETADVIRKAGR